MQEVKQRSFGLFILFNILTFGIYGLVVMQKMGKEIELFCDGDDEKQMPYLLAVLLGLITFGIYTIVWFYKQMERMKDNEYRYRIEIKYSAQDYLLWYIVGSFLAGIGAIIAMYMFFNSFNQYAKVYGQVAVAPYTNDVNLRNEYKAGKFRESSGNFRESSGSNYGERPTRPVRAQLICTNGVYRDAKFDVPVNETFIIGRDPSTCAIIIDGQSGDVSRNHLKVKFNSSNASYEVVDVSSNGTYFADGRRMERGMKYTLPKGSKIRLGKNEEFILN